MRDQQIRPRVEIRERILEMTKAPPKPPTIPESAKRLKYGIKWNPICDQRTGKLIAQMPDVLIEREILRNYDRALRQPGNEIMAWDEHFKLFVNHVLGRQDWPFRWHWNLYSETILRHVREEKLMAISGHASSGKSAFLSMYAVCMFLLFPENTKVLITSTSLKDSRNRVWGEVERMWNESARYFGSLYSYLKIPPVLPGKLVSSAGKITGLNADGKPNDLVGIALVAGGKGNDDVSNLIGFKAKNLLLLADELPLLTHALYDATSNLMANDGFKMLASGNFSSQFDPMGLFCEPADGWNSVDENTFEWRTRVNGLCIRFDGELSPNVRAGKQVYPGLLTKEGLDDIKARFGPKSPGYYRMVKSFPCPTGATDTIYSEPELTANLCAQGVNQWLYKPTPISFLDPSFSKGGDAAAASFGLIGVAQINGVNRQMLLKTDTLDLMKRVDARHKTKDRNEQLAELYIEECVRRNVAVEDRGVDATGGGDPFSTILAMKMGHGFKLVSFSGAASDMMVSSTDKRKGKDRFFNRVSELWYVGKEFVVGGQIRGLDPATMVEMCERTYTERGSKVQVEPKDDMKKRTGGHSPDRADSWVGLIEVARRRHKFTAAARAAKQVRPVGPARPWWEPAPPPKPTFRDQLIGDAGWGAEGNGCGWGESD